MRTRIDVNISTDTFKKLRYENSSDFLEVAYYPRVEEAFARELGQTFSRDFKIHFFLENRVENIKYTMLILLKRLYLDNLNEKSNNLDSISEMINFLERQ